MTGLAGGSGWGPGMVEALVAADDPPNAQRLGYLSRVLDNDALAEATHGWLGTRVYRVVPLEPEPATVPSMLDPEWKVLVTKRPDVSF